MRMTMGGKQMHSKTVETKEVERLRKIYGFDKPIVDQYFSWMAKIVQGDFGESFRTFRPVLAEISGRLPISLTFGL